MTEKLKYKRVLGDWVLGKTLGQGSMGKVKLAFNSTSKEKLACKIINRPIDAPDLPKGVTLIGPTDQLKDIICGQNRKSVKSTKDVFDNSRLLREVGVSLLLEHDNIVKLLFLYMDAENYYLFFQYVNGGQLLDYIISHGALNEKLSRKFLRQILEAVDYCHSNSIVHRDLKIENILLDKKGKVKLIDFGLANFVDPFKHLATFCGSLYFAAPEVLSAKKYIGPEVDMWSIGIILFVLVTGRVPFDDSTLPALHKKIKSGIYDSPHRVTAECLDLISRLLVVNPRERASMDEVKRHPWVMKNYEQLPGANSVIYPALKLPVNSNIIKKMVGLGFGTESEITKSLETYLKDKRSQGTQKWSIGGRTINCPESPLASVYKLTLIKLGKLQPLEAEHRRSLRKRSTTLGEKDMQRKSHWSLFGKNNVGTDETINKRNSFIYYGKENEPVKRVKKKGFMWRLYGDKHEKADDNVLASSLVEPLYERTDTARPSIDFSRDSENLRVDIPRESMDVPRESMDIRRPLMPSKSLDLRRDSSKTFGEPKSFFGTLSGFGKIHSKTQMDLNNSAEKPRGLTRLVSPSMAAIKAFSSKMFSKNEETAPTQNITGAATLDIKTSHLTGIFTIRNTTNLTVVQIRKEMVKAFSRVPNLEMIEQKGYFFCKFYDTVPLIQGMNHEKCGVHANDDSSVTIVNHSKPRAQFEVFIRKIPFSSLHGIQFNKISGDTYKYKKVCSQILSMASL